MSEKKKTGSKSTAPKSTTSVSSIATKGSITTSKSIRSLKSNKSMKSITKDEQKEGGEKESGKKSKEKESKDDDEDVDKAFTDLRILRRKATVVEEAEAPEEEEDPGQILHTRLKEENIALICKAFKKILPDNDMNYKELREMLRVYVSISMTDEEYNLLFVKMDTSRDGMVEWDEFVSYLLLEFQESEIYTTEELKLPIEGYPRVMRTQHRHPIARVAFSAEMMPDRSISYLYGKYVTVSRDGMIHYWSLDFEMEETVYSECPELKVRPTWITDLVCLPDVNITCTSSTERDIRFYDTTARKFELRIMISSWDHAIVCMHYHFNKNVNEDSQLILGDVGGNIRILLITSLDKGPFYHKPGRDLIHMRYEALARGDLKGMKLIEFRDIHTDWVRQVSYNTNLKSFMSCAPCPENSLYMRDVLGTKTQYSFNVAKGVTCFSFIAESHIIVTGGPDCIVRVWNAFVPKKASAVFQGHHAAIVRIVLQDNGNKIFSLSKDKCIKVWDVAAQSCIQTYIGLPAELGEHTQLSTYYNPLNRNLVVASMKIAIIVLGAVLNEERTDGYTHTMAVIKALYNPLFKVIVTVGLDSTIMVWDPWGGRRRNMMRNAHTRMSYGEAKPVEITAATFDPPYQQLLTGARDGTLKVWNFNTGTCVRNMEIESNCEVTSVIWLKNRILAVGWNRHVFEFPGDDNLTDGKAWETRHTEDVLCTACRPPQALATSSYNGELILWRLETGQAYKRYLVANPLSKFTLAYLKTANSKESIGSQRSKTSRTSSVFTAKSSSNSSIDRRLSRDALTVKSVLKGDSKRSSLLLSERNKVKRARRVSVIQLPPSGAVTRPLSVHSMIFLETRPMHVNVGTLFVALDNGNIQVWSHHSAGGFIGHFFAIHMAGDYVVSMATDPKNDYLFTGTTMGYIKIWLMKNYFAGDVVKICMPKYRLQFPFLWRDRIEGRAKRVLREQPLPLLLSSHRAHLRSINYLEYLPDCKMIVSSSSDMTVRLWTLGGCYLGTLGSFQPWQKLRSAFEPREGRKFRIPPDIGRVGSSSTMKVLRGGQVSFTHLTLDDDNEVLRELPKRLLERATYGKRATSPILGKHFELPPRTSAPAFLPVLDSSLPHVPVYCHLRSPDLEEVERPPTPQGIIQGRAARSRRDTMSIPSSPHSTQFNLSQLSKATSPSSPHSKSARKQIRTSKKSKKSSLKTDNPK